MRERVVITGARAAAALDIARDCARAGFAVHVADCAPARLARWSRAVTQFHGYPSPVRDPAGFATRIVELAATLRPRLIIPCCEEIFHLARPALAAQLGGALFAPPAALLTGLHDKGAFAMLCRDLGLPVPETYAIDDAAALVPFGGQSADWVFKPRFTRFGADALVGPDADRLAHITPSPRRRWIAQRRIIGREVCCHAVARAGTLTAFAAYGANWRLAGGASISFEPLDPPLADALLALARRLASATGLTGQFACDAIVDAAGQPWLIECNPRATSGVHLLARDGRLAAAMLGDGAELLEPSRAPRHLLPALLTYGLASAARNGRLRDWWRQVRTGRDVAGNRGDRLPMLGAMIDGLGFMAAGARHGMTATAATTADIAWNGEDNA